MPVIALSRVVPVQARLTGRVPVPISAAKCLELLDACVELELARGAADAGMPLMRARLRGCGLLRRLREPARAAAGAMTDVTSSRWHPALALVPRRLAQ